MIKKLKLRIGRLCRKIANKWDPPPHIIADRITKDIRRFRYERIVRPEWFDTEDKRMLEHIKHDIARQLVDQLDDLRIEFEDVPEGKRLSTKISVII